MLHKISSKYRELAKLVPGLAGRLPSHVRNKETLLEMAERGESRPKQNESPLGKLFGNYTSKNSQCYDQEFVRKIKKIAPEWLVSKTEIVRGKKQKLIEMARNGEPRPHLRGSPLGMCLSNYICKTAKTYDPKFAREIRKLAPQWFDPKSVQNKSALLDMAKKKEPKPQAKTHPLGHVLRAYTSKRSKQFDPKFTNYLKKIRPDWLVSKYDITKQRKAALLEMAKKGESRPRQKSRPFGVVLSRYTSEKNGSFDPQFTKKIKRLAPHWFPEVSEMVKGRKWELLQIAKSGKSKPSSWKNPLGAALFRYTSKNSQSYDPHFTNEIRRVRPDWMTTSAEKTKQKLLCMARKGQQKPKGGTNPLSCALLRYTSEKNGSFDPQFTKKIKKIAPQWFYSRTELLGQKKKQLIQAAKAGKKMPDPFETKIGSLFRRLVNPNHPMHDKEFTARMHRLAPAWMQNKYDATRKKKEKLIKMAKNKLERPKKITELGAALSVYTSKKGRSRDPEFISKISKLAPQWFVTQTDLANQNKDSLLLMAKKGEDRPKRHTKLGRCVYSYTGRNSGCYDPQFTKQIKKLAPEWFKKSAKENY